MSWNRSWKSEDRYFDWCPTCGERFPMVKMITIKKADRYANKKLTRLCENCYVRLLDFLEIKDVIL